MFLYVAIDLLFFFHHKKQLTSVCKPFVVKVKLDFYYVKFIIKHYLCERAIITVIAYKLNV